MLQSGPIVFALLIALLLTALASWVVANLYRRRMVSLMRTGPSPDMVSQHAAAAPPATDAAVPAALDFAANHQANRRFLWALSALSLLVALTWSALEQTLVYADLKFSLRAIFLMGIVYAWPMVLAWGLALRWNWWRIVAGLIAYMLTAACLMMLGSNEKQAFDLVIKWLALQLALPLLVVLFISASGRIRAIAPYLLPPVILLSISSVIVLAWLSNSIKTPPEWINSLLMVFGPTLTIVLIALSPWLLMAWPVYRVFRRLAQAYRAKRFSDLAYLFGAYWLVVLFIGALPALQEKGWIALPQMLAWLWIPLAWHVLKDRLAPHGKPPTLLVLRVFQRDAHVERLFDQVIERWRFSGNTVLIAGTDLMSRTIDPDDLFTYFNGRLAERFVATPEEVPQRIAQLDMSPDPDGRYRVNECYCFDTTWQAMLAALVKKADVVLMDLRGFQEKNAGCLHELGVLAQASHLQRVVLLHDATTQRSAAEAAVAAAPAGRFHWLEEKKTAAGMAGQVLAALFDGPAMTAATGNMLSRQQA